MKQELDKYFRAAKKLENLKDPLTNEELDSILSKVEIIDNSIYKFLTGGFMLLLIVSIIYLGMNIFSDEPSYIEIMSKSVNSGSINSSDISNKVVDDTLNSKQLIQKREENVNTTSTDDNGIIKNNPYRKIPREELIRNFSFGTGGKSVDFLEPASIQTNVEGNTVAGMMTLQLTKEELAKIGVNFDGAKINYNVEYYHILHPIPMRNNDAYRLDPENKEVSDMSYPANGDTLLVKAKHSIDIKYKADVNSMLEPSIPDKSYKLIPNIDTVDGKIRRNLRKVLLSNKNLIEVSDTVDGVVSKSYKRVFSDKNPQDDTGPDYLEYFEDWKLKYLQGFKSNILKYNGWDNSEYSKTLPIIAAFKYNGTRHRYIYQHYNSPIKLNYLNQLDYSKLIPLELKFGDSLLIEKLILWYYPTPEFISLLPERYQKVLSNELNILSKLNNGELDLNSACEKVEKETFFDICRFRNGVISIRNLYPNPAYQPVVTLDFDLSENRNVEINIYDLKGNFIGRISQLQKIEKGQHTMKLNLGKLTTGIYILGLKTNQNEFVSQRIVIN
jgi:hypothetical protein